MNTKTKWLILIVATLLLSACDMRPQAYADADRIREQARVEADRATIANDAERIRQETIAPVAAELEVARLRATQDLQTREQLAALELRYKTLEGDLQVATQQRIDELEANHQKMLADLQAQTDQSRAGAIAVMVIFIALSVGLTVLLTQAGHGIGYFFRAKGRNLGEIIYPRPGAVIARPEGFYIPGNIPGSYQLVHKPGLIERLARSSVYLIQAAQGKTPAAPDLGPWVQLPTPDQIMPDVIERAQSAALLAAVIEAAGKGGASANPVSRAAIGAAVSQIGSAASGGGYTIRRIDDPAEGERIQRLLNSEGGEP